MTLDIAALRQKLNELKGKGTQNNNYLQNFYNPPDYNDLLEQRSIIRILPGKINLQTGEREPWFTETILHKINGKNLHSPKVFGKPCPIAEYIRALWATEDPEKIEEAREIKGKKRFYMNVVAREREVEDERGAKKLVKNDGPLIYSCGIKVFEKILKAMINEKKYGDITDLQNGFDFKIVKEMQKSGYPGYDDSEPADESSPAGSREEIERWMENLHDLNNLIKHSSYDELLKELELYKSIKHGNADQNVSTSIVTESKESLSIDSNSNNTFANNQSEPEEDFLAALKRIQDRG